MSTTAPRCALDHASPTVGYVAGVPLCDRCAAGDLTAARALGWRIDLRRRVEPSLIGDVDVLEITLDTGRDGSLRARFVPFRRKARALQWFNAEVLTDDEAFTERVSATAEDVERVTEWLSQPDVRAALITLLGTRRELAIDGGWLALRGESEADPAPLTSAALALAALLPTSNPEP